MRTSLRLVAIVLLVIAAVAAGATTGAAAQRSVEIRPFEEVQGSDLRFERDPTDPTRGIFRVETTEPMICAVVWGRTKSFGRFNNSLAMNGTGIIDHDVLLPKAKSGVTYSYVVQGTTADGTLYRSKLGTFELGGGAEAKVSDAVDGLTDVTATATVTDVSSEFSSAFAATNAIDGDLGTEWATKGDGNEGSITLDLGRPTDVAAVEFVTRSMADGSARTSRYTVSIDDGAPAGPFRAGTVARPRSATIDSTGRVIRFDVDRSTGGNVGAVEIRVYASA